MSTTTSDARHVPPRPTLEPDVNEPGASTEQDKPADDSLHASDFAGYFLAGGCAGIASRTVVAPLERLKLIYQCQSQSEVAYNGLIASLRKIWREEGMRGMFRGNYANVLRIAPYSATQFLAYEQAKRVLSNEQHELSTPRKLLAGAIAGVASVVTTYPLDLIRCRVSIASASIGKSTAEAASLSMYQMGRHVVRTEGGVRALYKGCITTSASVAPYIGCQFYTYELFRGHFEHDGEHASTFNKLCCGALAGGLSQTLTYPLDVVRRVMQVSGMSKMDYHYNSAREAMVDMVRREGIRSLYKGLSINLLKVSPSIATSFATYEWVRDLTGAEHDS
ncbi:uncharacterized protein L969DRAFT_384968 [Mixia osmundae IAM 14324]|uniref:Mitochondrial carrier protein n=1 Tax=Mixia osmundae (strain CBS 9802 / IAM 14324 / JCM 22182 / KY 12970) TaxID=764103 RepID=G7E9E1_MIXOS|nr:uncharacterized protein L969DRAFT_384968 [Mixia osmundae IAM 14324]KEI39890.1 hypothetical protein L969DRAFT_384968 [Mixia osmundae IAM 14324]GAA99260.1 hypothetical protein E5Q_05954 [Mixia osmundae IAM 14324]